MRNRFKCTKCYKIFYLTDRNDLTDKESRKSVLCNKCFKGLLKVKSYEGYKNYLSSSIK